MTGKPNGDLPKARSEPEPSEVPGETPHSLVEVVVTLPVEGTYHYRVPAHLLGKLERGHRVLVPFGVRRVTGFVLRTSSKPPENLDEAKIKPVEARLDTEPLLPSTLFDLVQFAADYYLAEPGEVLKVALPPGLTGASKLRFLLSAEGRRALEDQKDRLPGGAPLTAAHWELLRVAQGPGLPRARMRGQAAQALERAGWLVARDALSARDGGGEVEIATRLLVPALAEPFLMNAKNRRAIYDALSAGPRTVANLRAEFGTARLRSALQRLIDDKVVEVRTVAPESLPSSPAWASVSARADAPRKSLSPAQAAAVEAVTDALGAEESSHPSRAFLLQGVTGSGKTEVYLAIIEHVLLAGRGAIVLVPEIALTPQLEGRFRERFGEQVVVLHSAVPDAERRRRWRTLREGRAKIALGPRSAVWAPVDRLGAIIVDEEHDASFKQQSELRYHGRDLALVRAQRAGAVVVLGSATPSLEALVLVERKKLTRLRLDERVGGRPMPTIETVDLAEERRALKGEVRLLSRALDDALRELRAKGEQAILFLNRRGFNTVVHCGACDDVKKCPHCDVSLTFHRAAGKTACHYCGYEEPLSTACRSCGSSDVRPLGAGTERVVDSLQASLPDLRILRLDRDITQRAGQLDEVLERFRAGDADVLVGTQMVAKGHDFPRVTLVGIVLADASLAFPDFRAAERTFQLITQVAGRAGRAERPGRVIIQTLQPHHYALTTAVGHDVDAFFSIERASRESAMYPPFSRLGAIRAEAFDSDEAERVAHRATELALQLKEGEALRVIGPAPAPIGRVRNRFRYLTLLFAPTPARLVGWMRKIRRAALPEARQVDLVFDVDAIDLL